MILYQNGKTTFSLRPHDPADDTKFVAPIGDTLDDAICSRRHLRRVESIFDLRDGLSR